MKYFRIIMGTMLTIVFITGCGTEKNVEDNNNIEQQKEEVIEQQIPQEMTGDFNFIVRYGYGKVIKNEINTFEDTVTKDLINDGSVTTSISLSNEEMRAIYKRMKEINIMAPKKFVPEKVNCMQEPHEDDEWEVKINGEIITHYLFGTYCEKTSDAKQLLELRNYVFNIIKNRDEYKELPEANGGYE